VDVTKYGSIVDWPIDFFDQAQEEAEKIMAAATAKRAAEEAGGRKRTTPGES
jgi:predicted ATPase